MAHTSQSRERERERRRETRVRRDCDYFMVACDGRCEVHGWQFQGYETNPPEKSNILKTIIADRGWIYNTRYILHIIISLAILMYPHPFRVCWCPFPLPPSRCIYNPHATRLPGPINKYNLQKRQRERGEDPLLTTSSGSGGTKKINDEFYR